MLLQRRHIRAGEITQPEHLQNVPAPGEDEHSDWLFQWEQPIAQDETAFAIQELLAARCAIAPADRTTRKPGEPGVRLRCFLDLRQAPDA